MSVQDKNWNNKQESTDNKQENMYNDNEKIVQEENNYTYLTYGNNRNSNEFYIKY